MSAYIQCMLQKGSRKIEYWVPKQHAKPGRVITIKLPEGLSDGWTVRMLGKEKVFDFKKKKSLWTLIKDFVKNS